MSSVGISSSEVWRIEAGNRRPSAKVLAKFQSPELRLKLQQEDSKRQLEIEAKLARQKAEIRAQLEKGLKKAGLQ